MSLATLATVLVACAFLGLCVWVLWPSNKARFERDANIPFQEPDEPKEPRHE
jgi:cbb3-type cytochrome oxidase subunit 3